MITRAHAHILPASLPRFRRLPRAVTTHGSGIALREWHQDQESEVSHIAIAAADGLLPTDVDLSTSAGGHGSLAWARCVLAGSMQAPAAGSLTYLRDVAAG